MRHDEHQTGGFASGYRRALSDEKLQYAMAGATARFNAAEKADAFKRGEEWESLRARARQIKEHAISHLDYYLEQFAENVERGGGRVFWAADARAANEYVVRLARERGVISAVKGKSMMSEEVGLNRALDAAGVEAVETDLGEYIVQLAGERPSHINMPAVHKSRADVADLLADKLHAPRTDDIGEMTALARRVLRSRFAEAGMGITGVNFAVAETGTIVLVENEGNIRMSTSLPRVHVALMGVEKIVPRLSDLSVLLPLLTLSASGQEMCSYVSMLTGVKDSVRHEEGPEELHVVILDNGRSEILADEELRESLYCIRCGACLNTCPVYQKIGGHAYGWVYPGPIGSVLTPQLIGLEQAADLPFASTLCGACRSACPVKINIPDMLLYLRHQIKEAGEQQKSREGVAQGHDPADGPSRGQARPANVGVRTAPAKLKERLAVMAERAALKLWAVAMKDAGRYRLAARLARLAQKILGRVGIGATGGPLAGRWGHTRDFPQLAPRSFRESWAEDRSSTKR